MTEGDYYDSVINIGYFLLAARGAIVLAFLVRYTELSKRKVLRPLFLWSVIGFFVAFIEVFFILLINSFPVFFTPYLIKYDIDDTFFTSPFYFLNEILLLGIFFSRIINGKIGGFILIVCYVLFLLEVLNTVFGEGYKDAQNIGSFFTSLFIIILALLFFRRYFILKIRNTLSNDALNLIVWGFFSISTFSILILFFSDQLFTDFPTLYYQISMCRMIIEILGLMLIAYGVSIFKPFIQVN